MIKLSEAIRLGSMIRPQTYGRLYGARDVPIVGDVLGLRQERVASCALGAAYEAAGCPSKTITAVADAVGTREPVKAGAAAIMVTVPPQWTWSLGAAASCPMCDRRDVVIRLIAHLNDEHLWSRERVADWIETLEGAPLSATHQRNWRSLQRIADARRSLDEIGKKYR